jgi:rubrerythrin
MSKPQLPSVGEVLGPILARVPVEKRPLVIAAAERMAAERYRGWAREVVDAEQKSGLQACAEREDEIARRVESLFADAASAQRELTAGLPGIAELNLLLFGPHTIGEQFRIQAQGERLGAATWRFFARHAENPQTAQVFESCAVLEEESAAFLEALSK